MLAVCNFLECQSRRSSRLVNRRGDFVGSELHRASDEKLVLFDEAIGVALRFEESTLEILPQSQIISLLRTSD